MTKSKLKKDEKIEETSAICSPVIPKVLSEKEQLEDLLVKLRTFGMKDINEIENRIAKLS